jgi:hypothetical protein
MQLGYSFVVRDSSKLDSPERKVKATVPKPAAKTKSHSTASSNSKRTPKEQKSERPVKKSRSTKSSKKSKADSNEPRVQVQNLATASNPIGLMSQNPQSQLRILEANKQIAMRQNTNQTEQASQLPSFIQAREQQQSNLQQQNIHQQQQLQNLLAPNPLGTIPLNQQQGIPGPQQLLLLRNMQQQQQLQNQSQQMSFNYLQAQQQLLHQINANNSQMQNVQQHQGQPSNRRQSDKK